MFILCCNICRFMGAHLFLLCYDFCVERDNGTLNLNSVNVVEQIVSERSRVVNKCQTKY